MSSFRCDCGRTIRIDSPSDRAGYLVWDSDVDTLLDARKAEIRGYCAAVTSGQRDAWLRYIYGAEHPASVAAKTHEDVIEDILSHHESCSSFCYRCDACGSLYVQEGPGSANFQRYRPM